MNIVSMMQLQIKPQQNIWTISTDWAPLGFIYQLTNLHCVDPY